jgi:hypothetical protein
VPRSWILRSEGVLKGVHSNSAGVQRIRGRGNPGYPETLVLYRMRPITEHGEVRKVVRGVRCCTSVSEAQSAAANGFGIIPAIAIGEGIASAHTRVSLTSNFSKCCPTRRSSRRFQPTDPWPSDVFGDVFGLGLVLAFPTLTTIWLGGNAPDPYLVDKARCSRESYSRENFHFIRSRTARSRGAIGIRLAKRRIPCVF